MNEVTRNNVSRITILLCAVALAAPALAGGDKGAKFKAMDANGDGLVSSAEHAASVTKMFGEMDTDGDGRISATEMDAKHSMHAASGAASEPRTMNDAADYSGDAGAKTGINRMANMDTDGDGMLTSAEHDAGAASMFTAMDADGNGSLTQQEFSAAHAMKKSKP